MKAFITGASSGLGREFARLLSEQGYDLILVARRKERLEEVKKELKTDVAIYAVDISSTFNCVKLFNKIKNEPIDLVINNAGFGVFGDFYETKLEDELDMIDLNIKAVHTLTKLFLTFKAIYIISFIKFKNKEGLVPLINYASVIFVNAFVVGLNVPCSLLPFQLSVIGLCKLEVSPPHDFKSTTALSVNAP